MHFTSGTMIVRCAQTGQKKITKLEALGRADQMPICETDCVDGAELLITEHGQEYPVTFVSFSGVMMHWYQFGRSIHILYCYSDKRQKKKSHQPSMASVATPPTPTTLSRAQVTASTQTAKTTQNVVKGILKKAKDTMKPVRKI